MPKRSTHDEVLLLLGRDRRRRSSPRESTSRRILTAPAVTSSSLVERRVDRVDLEDASTPWLLSSSSSLLERGNR